MALFNTFKNGATNCLKNVPQKIFDSPTCGNGFVESGEECDCGLPSACKSSCCNPQTCKLKPNVPCSAGKQNSNNLYTILTLKRSFVNALFILISSETI